MNVRPLALAVFAVLGSCGDPVEPAPWCGNAVVQPSGDARLGKWCLDLQFNQSEDWDYLRTGLPKGTAAFASIAMSIRVQLTLSDAAIDQSLNSFVSSYGPNFRADAVLVSGSGATQTMTGVANASFVSPFVSRIVLQDAAGTLYDWSLADAAGASSGPVRWLPKATLAYTGTFSATRP